MITIDVDEVTAEGKSSFISFKMIFLPLLMVFIVNGLAAPLACVITCGQGEYCSQDACKPCPEGQYQDSLVHTETSCKKWTEKPVQAHWVIKKNGTSKSDIEWGCETGFVEKEISASVYYCVEEFITSTQSATSTTQKPAVVSSTTLPTENTSPPATSNKDDIGVGGKVGIGLGILIIGILIIIICLWRKQKCCFTTSSPVTTASIHENIALDSMPNKSRESKGKQDANDTNKIELQRNALPEGIDFPYFREYVKKLGYDNAKKLLYSLSLDDGSTFSAEISMGFEQKKNNDPQIFMTNTFLRWAEANPRLNHKIEILDKINDLGFGYLVSLDTQHEDGDEENIRSRQDQAEETEYQKQSPKKNKNLLRLFLHMVEKLGPDDSVRLLNLLPTSDSHFVAREEMRMKELQHQDFQTGFAETMQEWAQRHPKIVKSGQNITLAECLNSILVEMSRNDLVQDEKYQYLVSAWGVSSPACQSTSFTQKEEMLGPSRQPDMSMGKEYRNGSTILVNDGTGETQALVHAEQTPDNDMVEEDDLDSSLHDTKRKELLKSSSDTEDKRELQSHSSRNALSEKGPKRTVSYDAYKEDEIRTEADTKLVREPGSPSQTKRKELLLSSGDAEREEEPPPSRSVHKMYEIGPKTATCDIDDAKETQALLYAEEASEKAGEEEPNSSTHANEKELLLPSGDLEEENEELKYYSFMQEKVEAEEAEASIPPKQVADMAKQEEPDSPTLTKRKELIRSSPITAEGEDISQSVDNILKEEGPQSSKNTEEKEPWLSRSQAADVTKVKQAFFPPKQSANGTKGVKSGARNGPLLSHTRALTQSATREVKKNFSLLFDHLADKLTPDESRKLLRQLPNKNQSFNADICFRFKEISKKDFKTCFAETMDNWLSKNPETNNEQILAECLRKVLAEIGRDDIMGGDAFLSHFPETTDQP